MSKGKGTWDARYGKKILSTADVPVVGRESKGELLKALSRNPDKRGILNHVELGPEPIKGTEAQPYLGTDHEYMARERARASEFEKTFGIKHERKMEETDSLVASEKRIAVTYRQQELPTGDKEKDKSIKKPVVVKRLIEVPFGDITLDMPITEEEIAAVVAARRIDIGDEIPVGEDLEVEVEERGQEASKRRFER